MRKITRLDCFLGSCVVAACYRSTGITAKTSSTPVRFVGLLLATTTEFVQQPQALDFEQAEREFNYCLNYSLRV